MSVTDSYIMTLESYVIHRHCPDPRKQPPSLLNYHDDESEKFGIKVYKMFYRH
jgi:hypothetical protein